MFSVFHNRFMMFMVDCDQPFMVMSGVRLSIYRSSPFLSPSPSTDPI